MVLKASLVVSAKASPADIARAPSATMPLSALIFLIAAVACGLVMQSTLPDHDPDAPRVMAA